MKVYLSSTYLDLKSQRRAVGKMLRKAQYDVVMMEDYPARAGTAEFESTGDVAGCDVLVGLVAKRYGFVPGTDNPERKSITEMEYEAAGQIPKLGFLLQDKARWPAAMTDSDATQVERFRARWQKEHTPGYFRWSSELPAEVLAALRKQESTQLTRRLEAIQVIHEAQKFGPSFLTNLKDKISALQQDGFLEFQIGPDPWWNTRLHLVAALAEMFGKNQRFVFANEARSFLAMAPADQVRKRLAAREPRLEQACSAFRQRGATLEALGERLWQFPQDVKAAFDKEEPLAREDVTDDQLRYELGLRRDAETVEEAGKKETLRLQEIIGRPTPFVALLRANRFEGKVVDTGQLARAVAGTALAQFT